MKIVLDETYYPRPFGGGVGIIGNATVTGTDINIRTVQPAEPNPMPPPTGTTVYPDKNKIKISSELSVNGKSESLVNGKNELSEKINSIFSEKNIIYIVIVAILLIWLMR